MNDNKKSDYEYRKHYYADRRRRRKMNGQCVVCGVKLPEGCATVNCPNCQDKARFSYKKHREKRKAERKEPKDRVFLNADLYNLDEANICLTCKAVTCTGNCIRFKTEKAKLEVSDGG